MKKIKLTQGKYALVDDIDFEWLNQWKWNVAGFENYYRAENSKKEKMHRLIMNPSRDQFIDHIDGNELNNQRNNLRICSRLENSQNRKVNKDKLLWRIRITYNKKTIHLGRLKDKTKAAKLYNEKALELFGEFARLNIII